MKDRVLTVALTMYEAGLCGTCGYPLTICRDPEMNGWLKAAPEVCQGEESRQLWIRKQGKNWEPEPGQVIGVRLDSLS